MGTRGTYGFHHEGKDLLSYNHGDSHPPYLGASIGKFLVSWFERGLQAGDLKNDVSRLLVVKENPPTPLSIELAKRLSVSGAKAIRLEPGAKSYGGNHRYPGEMNWYHTLRDQQGNLELTLRRGIILADNDFILDSLFCQYAYILNLDQEVIEFYKGGVRLDEPCVGRYAAHVPDSRSELPYRACTLDNVWPLTAEGSQRFLESMLTRDA